MEREWELRQRGHRYAESSRFLGYIWFVEASLQRQHAYKGVRAGD
jgi:hypothetical protein